MKKNIIFLVLVSVILGLVVFAVVRERNVSKVNLEAKTNVSKINQRANLWQATLKISGMSCVSCATGIMYVLKQKNGVVSANVDYDNKIGKVVYDPSKISKDEIIKAIKPYIAVITADVPLK